MNGRYVERVGGKAYLDGGQLTGGQTLQSCGRQHGGFW